MDSFKVIKNCSLSYILEDNMYYLEEDSLAFNEERFKPVSPLYLVKNNDIIMIEIENQDFSYEITDDTEAS